MPDSNLTRKQDAYSYHVLTRRFDFNEWKQVAGKAVLGSDYISPATDCQIATYKTFIYGDFTFDIEFSAAPGALDENIFGFVSPDLLVTRGGIYLRANTDSLILNVISEDGTTSIASVTIPWQTAWNTTRVRFGLRWGFDGVTALADGVIIGKIKADIPTDIVIPSTPQHLILSNAGPTQTMKVYNIVGKNIGTMFDAGRPGEIYNDSYEAGTKAIAPAASDYDIAANVTGAFVKNRQQVTIMTDAAISVKLNATTNPSIAIAANTSHTFDRVFVSNMYVSSTPGANIQIISF